MWEGRGVTCLVLRTELVCERGVVHCGVHGIVRNVEQARLRRRRVVAAVVVVVTTVVVLVVFVLHVERPEAVLGPVRGAHTGRVARHLAMVAGIPRRTCGSVQFPVHDGGGLERAEGGGPAIVLSFEVTEPPAGGMRGQD